MRQEKVIQSSRLCFGIDLDTPYPHMKKLHPKDVWTRQRQHKMNL